MIITAGFIVLTIKLIVLWWVGWQTRKLAAIVYLIYLIGAIFIGTRTIPLMAFAFWYSGKEIPSWDTLTTTCESIGTILNDGLLIWVFLSLTGRYRR